VQRKLTNELRVIYCFFTAGGCIFCCLLELHFVWFTINYISNVVLEATPSSCSKFFWPWPWGLHWQLF